MLNIRCVNITVAVLVSLVMTTAQAQQPARSANMTFFVTSVGLGKVPIVIAKRWPRGWGLARRLGGPISAPNQQAEDRRSTPGKESGQVPGITRWASK